MAIKCPVPNCEDSEREFGTEAALKSHIRNKHPDYIPEEQTREVPIVEEDFAILLRKFKIRGDLAVNIAENISHTGGPRAFEDPDILIKRLSLWSTEISPGKRNLIVEQWFAERSIDIPPEVQQKAGMTTDQLREAEKEAKEKETDVRYIYDTDVREIRMAREGERGGTLTQAKELKRIAEEDNDDEKESPFIQDAEGNWMLNPKAKVTGIDYMAVQFMQRSHEKGEPVDPIEALTMASERMKTLRDVFGGGGNNPPAWLTDPVAAANFMKTISGNSGEDSALKGALAEMQQTIEGLKEERWQAQFDALQKQIQDVTGVLSKTLDTIADIKKDTVGRTEMDILHDVATDFTGLLKVELPGLRKDIKDAVGNINLPSPKNQKQREDRKAQYKEAISIDREIEELGQRLFMS